MPAGYSGTPLAKKLGVKPGHRVLLCEAPAGFERRLRAPQGVEVRRDLRGKQPFDVILLFAARGSVLTKRFDSLRKRMATDGGFWIAWPKKSSGRQTDLGEADVRAHGLAAGLVDNKICAVDETWSGLCFVIRVRDR